MNLSHFLYKILGISYRLRKFYLKWFHSWIAPKQAYLHIDRGWDLLLQPKYDYVQRVIYYDDGNLEYEKHIVDWLNAELKLGMTAVEIGAHIGYFAMLICDLIGEKGKAWFLEPFPPHHKILKHNLELNGFDWGEAMQLSMSDQVGVLNFFPATDSGRNSLAKNEFTDQDSIEVESTTFDIFFQQSGCSIIDLVMIDVEGAEALILRGAEDVLGAGKIKTILCELHPDRLIQDYKISPESFVEMVVGFGYSVTSIDEHSGGECEFSKSNLNDYQHLVFRKKN